MFYAADWNPDTADHVYVTAHDADSVVPEGADRMASLFDAAKAISLDTKVSHAYPD